MCQSTGKSLLGTPEVKVIPGSFEALQQALDRALAAAMPCGDGEWQSIRATMGDSVIVTRWSGNTTESFVLGYDVDEDGAIVLTEPQPVEITEVVSPLGAASSGDAVTSEEDLAHKVDAMTEEDLAIKALGLTAEDVAFNESVREYLA
jgi:hypothetical protein